MKRRVWMLAGMVALMTVVAAGCSKEHQCKCVTTDVPDNGFVKLLTVGGGLDCESITELAVERPAVDSVTQAHTLERVEVHTVTCREYGDQ